MNFAGMRNRTQGLINAREVFCYWDTFLVLHIMFYKPSLILVNKKEIYSQEINQMQEIVKPWWNDKFLKNSECLFKNLIFPIYVFLNMVWLIIYNMIK